MVHQCYSTQVVIDTQEMPVRDANVVSETQGCRAEYRKEYGEEDNAGAVNVRHGCPYVLPAVSERGRRWRNIGGVSNNQNAGGRPVLFCI